MPRLTIELVPSTSWFSNVRSEVPAAVWEKLKKVAYKLAHYRCEICSGRGRKWPVECHEVWHYDDASHIQKLVRLIALCPMCHRVKHIGFASLQPDFNDVIAHLMKVNQWSDRITAESYIKQCAKVWEGRSKHDWTLDISCLKQYGFDPASIKRPVLPVTREQMDRISAALRNVGAPEPDFDPFDHIIGEERIA